MPVGLLERLLDARTLRHLALQRAIGALQLRRCPLQRRRSVSRSSRVFSACSAVFACGELLVGLRQMRLSCCSSRRLQYSSTSTATLLRRISGTTGIDT